MRVWDDNAERVWGGQTAYRHEHLRRVRLAAVAVRYATAWSDYGPCADQLGRAAFELEQAHLITADWVQGPTKDELGMLAARLEHEPSADDLKRAATVLRRLAEDQ